MTYTTRVRAAAAFEQPEQGSEFHDAIISLSIPHTKRDEPAWMYAIEDAERGAKLENTRLQPLLELLGEALDALALAQPFVENTNSIVAGQKRAYAATRIALARANQILDSRIANSEGEGK